jgi:hypothetical protein
MKGNFVQCNNNNNKKNFPNRDITYREKEYPVDDILRVSTAGGEWQ